MSTALSTIVTQARSNFPSGFHADDLTTTVLTRYANDLQRELCRAYNFAFMKQEVTRSTANETQKYTLPVAGGSAWTRVLERHDAVLRFKRDISLELINSQGYRLNPSGVGIIKLHKQILEDKKVLAKETGTGIPRYYDVDQGRLWLYKIPKHSLNADTAWTMNLEFFGYLADLASGGNNVLTNEHPLVLEYGITAKGYAWAKDWPAFEKYVGLARDVFAAMVDEDKDLQLSGIEEGFFPDPAQSIGGGDPYKGFLQGTDWYVS